MSLRYLAFASLILFGFANSHAFAANPNPCRNDKGQFTKCEKAPAKPTRCRDAKGRFMSCSATKTPAAANTNMPASASSLKSDMKQPTNSPVQKAAPAQ